MKRKILTLLLLTLFSFTGCTNNKHVDISQLEDIALVCDMQNFDYSELNEQAGIIAKVKVLDDLTPENSYPEYIDIDGKPHLTSAIAKRKIQVLEFYKNNANTSETTMEIIEGAAIIDNSYYHDEGYRPLKKDNVYIVYLSNDTASGEYSLISGMNGLIDIASPLENEEYTDIAVKTFVEYESDLPDSEKQKIINSDIKLTDDIPNEKKKYLDISVDKNSKTENIQFVYQEDMNTIFIEK